MAETYKLKGDMLEKCYELHKALIETINEHFPDDPTEIGQCAAIDAALIFSRHCVIGNIIGEDMAKNFKGGEERAKEIATALVNTGMEMHGRFLQETGIGGMVHLDEDDLPEDMKRIIEDYEQN